MNNLIKFDDSVSAQALTDLQEHVKLLPAVITTEKEFKTIYENYQNVRRLRIAVGKQSEELVKSFKTTFEIAKKEIQGKESAVLKILTPIEFELKSTRQLWEDKVTAEAEEKAAELAAQQEKEFNRADIIRKWDQAHLENQAHDQKILDDIERERKDEELKAETERLKKEKEEFEAKQLEFKKQVDEFEAYKVDGDFDASPEKIAEKSEQSIKEYFDHEKIREPLEISPDMKKKGVKIQELSQDEVNEALKPVYENDPDFDPRSLNHTDQESDECTEYEYICPKCGNKFDIQDGI